MSLNGGVREYNAFIHEHCFGFQLGWQTSDRSLPSAERCGFVKMIHPPLAVPPAQEEGKNIHLF